jgi:hypothetical protein
MYSINIRSKIRTLLKYSQLEQYLLINKSLSDGSNPKNYGILNIFNFVSKTNSRMSLIIKIWLENLKKIVRNSIQSPKRIELLLIEDLEKLIHHSTSSEDINLTINGLKYM